MKKYLFLLLLISGSVTYPISYKNIFWFLVSPVRSIDSEAESMLALWHEKRDGKYFWNDDAYTNDGRRIGDLRRAFPEDDPTSKDRLVKALLLARNNRLMRIGGVLLDPNGGLNHFHTLDADYETTWEEQPKSERFWWKIRYCRPYTSFATLAKWGLEIAIVAGCIKAAYELKKWYQNRAKQEKLKTAQEGSEVSCGTPVSSL